jgi:2-haloacid dehalogenase
MTAPITSVVFDLGGVLIDVNPDYLYRKLIPDEKERRDFLTNVCSREWGRRLDEGISFAENAKVLLQKYSGDPHMQSLIRAWDKRLGEMFAGPVQGTVDILEELNDANIPLYALTNMSEEEISLEWKLFPFYALFKDMVVSAVERVMKPDPKIYEILLNRTKIDPRRSIYIDDRAENLPPAAALGFTTILFTTPEALRAELIRHNLPLLKRCAS